MVYKTEFSYFVRLARYWKNILQIKLNYCNKITKESISIVYKKLYSYIFLFTFAVKLENKLYIFNLKSYFEDWLFWAIKKKFDAFILPKWNTRRQKNRNNIYMMEQITLSLPNSCISFYFIKSFWTYSFISKTKVISEYLINIVDIIF